MDLILWRHAEAEDGIPDLGRALTGKGRKQAARVAAWLKQHIPEDTRILASPALRTVQTAQALGRPFDEVAAIAPGADVEDVLRAAGWPAAKRAVLVVGHQPVLGQVAARLLFGEARDVSVRKAGVWWFQLRDRAGAEVVLRAVVDPDWL
jgi:phosphohistidine phosphatase